MRNALVNSLVATAVGSLMMVGGAMATTIPSEWLEIFPTSTTANGSQLTGVGSGPAYWIYTDDVARTKWNVVWTGSGVADSTTDPDRYFFSGTVLLQDTTGVFDTFDFEYGGTYGDSLVVNATPVANNTTVNGTSATLTAYASNGYDGFTISLMNWTLPSYIGFDLKAANTNGNKDMSDLIYIGATGATAADLQLALGQVADEDFRIAAPVPEPATMLLFGAGLMGLAGVTRRRKSNK